MDKWNQLLSLFGKCWWQRALPNSTHHHVMYISLSQASNSPHLIHSQLVLDFTLHHHGHLVPCEGNCSVNFDLLGDPFVHSHSLETPWSEAAAGAKRVACGGCTSYDGKHAPCDIGKYGKEIWIRDVPENGY